MNIELNTAIAMRPSFRSISLALLAAITPSSAVAATVLTGGVRNTTGFPSYVGGYTQGFDFTSTTTQQVSALGFWDSAGDGLASSYTVGLWQTSTQALLASVTISSADTLDTRLTVGGGQWRYETLGATMNLTSGTTYTLGFYIPTNMSSADSLLLEYPTVTTASTVAIGNEVRYVSSGALTFPNCTGAAGNNYKGQINALLVPEPGIANILALGALALLTQRRINKVL